MNRLLSDAMHQAVYAADLVFAAGLAGALGYQRHRRGRPAGIRTHVLVAVAACAFTLAGAYGFSDIGGARAPDRVAAQVVSGIGFLGAGVIWKTKTSLTGVTTAASLWMAAALGVLTGAQLYGVAASGAANAYLTLAAVQEPKRRPEHDDRVTEDGDESEDEDEHDEIT